MQDHDARGVVDPHDHAVVATPSGSVTLYVTSEGFDHPGWILW
jgi:hypothetical protein